MVRACLALPLVLLGAAAHAEAPAGAGDWLFVARTPAGAELARLVPLDAVRAELERLRPLGGGLRVAGPGPIDAATRAIGDADAAVWLRDSVAERAIGARGCLPAELTVAARRRGADVELDGHYRRSGVSPFAAAGAPLACARLRPSGLLAEACARLTPATLAELLGPIAWRVVAPFAGSEVSAFLVDVAATRPNPALVIVLESPNEAAARAGMSAAEALAQPFGVRFKPRADGVRVAPVKLAPGMVVAWTVASGHMFIATHPDALAAVQAAWPTKAPAASGDGAGDAASAELVVDTGALATAAARFPGAHHARAAGLLALTVDDRTQTVHGALSRHATR